MSTAMTVTSHRLEQLLSDLVQVADEDKSAHAAAVLRHLVSQSRKMARRGRKGSEYRDTVLVMLAPELVGKRLTKRQYNWLIERLMVEVRTKEPPSHLPIFILEECEDERTVDVLLSVVDKWVATGAGEDAVDQTASALSRLGPHSASWPRIRKALQDISAKASNPFLGENTADNLAALQSNAPRSAIRRRRPGKWRARHRP